MNYDFLIACKEFWRLVEEDESFSRFKYVKKEVLAQWCLESGWGKSKLAIKCKNYGGLKYRRELLTKIEFNFSFLDYNDWEKAEDAYFCLEKPEDYPKLYNLFLQRKIYKNVRYTSGLSFLFTLAKAGYVASMPDGKGGKVRSDYIPFFYTKRIFQIKKSEKFKQLIKEIEK